MQSVPTPTNQEINIRVDIALLAQALAADPAFIAAISTEVRTQMTKDVRWMGNLFAQWASTSPIFPSSKTRIN